MPMPMLRLKEGKVSIQQARSIVAASPLHGGWHSIEAVYYFFRQRKRSG